MTQPPQEQAQRPPAAKPSQTPRSSDDSAKPPPSPPPKGDGEDVRLLDSDEDTPLLDLLTQYKAGDVDWDEVLEFCEGHELAPRKSMHDVGWHSAEDEFPQAGTLDELLAADLDDEEVDELYALLAPEEADAGEAEDEEDAEAEEEPEAE